MLIKIIGSMRAFKMFAEFRDQERYPQDSNWSE